MSKPLKIVLTGGPCAGKTTLTHVIAKVFHSEIAVVPESASLLFSGGFPRWTEAGAQDATQKAIFHVQSELEAAFSARYPEKTLVLDRGTVDGAAYWSRGPEDFFKSLGTSLEAELGRYDQVIYLESAGREDYLANVKKNPNRTEDWEQAHRLDVLTRLLWEKHPRMTVIRNDRSFHHKISEVLELIGSGSNLG